MSGNKVKATARARITIEFPVGGQVWGEDCSVEQVHKQALEAAIGILRHGLRIGGVGEGTTFGEIIGEPEVTAILVTPIK